MSSSAAISARYAEYMRRPLQLRSASSPPSAVQHSVPSQLIGLIQANRLLRFEQHLSWPAFASALASTMLWRCNKHLRLPPFPIASLPAAAAVHSGCSNAAVTDHNLLFVCNTVRASLPATLSFTSTSASTSATSTSDSESSSSDEAALETGVSSSSDESEDIAIAHPTTTKLHSPLTAASAASSRLVLWCHLLLWMLQEVVSECEVTLSVAEIALTPNRRHWYGICVFFQKKRWSLPLT